MANPTTNQTIDYANSSNRIELPVVDTVQLYVGEYAVVDPASGRLTFPSNSATEIPCGVVQGAADGDNTEILGDTAGDERAVALGDVVQKKVSVVGVTGQADVSKYVFMQDGGVLSLTAGNRCACGVITKWHETTICDVHLFSFSWAKTLRASFP